jgi:DNA polymerase-3 subunit alpha
VKASAKKMPAVAMTDTGNMMGAFHFVSAVMNHNKVAKAKIEAAIEKGEEPTETEIKPIVGCEFNICDDHKDKPRKIMVIK